MALHVSDSLSNSCDARDVIHSALGPCSPGHVLHGASSFDSGLRRYRLWKTAFVDVVRGFLRLQLKPVLVC